MKISILAIGSRGDVQPLVALGSGLRAAGYEVCIATHAMFERLITDTGLPFSPVQANPKEVLESEAGRASMQGGANPMRSWLDFARAVSPLILQAGADCQVACQTADAIIYSPVGFFIGPHIAEKMGVPHVGAWLQPGQRTRAFPLYASPTSRDMGGTLNLLTGILMEALYWWPYRSGVNRFRQEQLGLTPIPASVNYCRCWQETTPVLYGFSPSIVPKPRDWPDHAEITGYWFLDRPAAWQPPADLVDFLAAGPPPVYVGFGSFPTRSPEQLTELVLKALARARQRGLLLTGWGGLSQTDLPDDVFKIDAVPHDWLFPQMAAVVHHGGAGTTAAGLRAGIPSIVVPFVTDGPFWAQRVADLGVGPRPIPGKRLSVERLACAITEAVGDKGMRERAARLGERIRAEDGLGRAVEAIDRYLSVDQF